ncbi:uncharacterized protein LOC143283688 [Babylonia areolata]|uniref:uncharacterized protein LOC143283688 n=1 Tax=Babylonia areolata TaxID=304850 RepID=UPI003FD30EDF
MGKTTDEFIGCKTTFRLKNESDALSGEIQNVDTENRTITFYKVTIHHPGKPPKVLGGLLQYHIDELADVHITNEVNQALRQASLGKPPDRNPSTGKKKKGIRHEKEVPRHLENFVEFDSTLLYMMNIVEKEMEVNKDKNGQYKSKLPPSCTLLDDVGSKLFRDACDHLKKCSTVGVTFEGVNLGRSGELSWILVSTWEHVMYFDIKTMGKDCFDAGMRDFMESTKIMKVIHDCRRPSDMLFHQYNTKLINIFDTQVGAVCAFKALNKNSYPRYVTNLAESLRNELGINDDEIHVPYVREHCPQKDEEVWTLRPAPSIVYEWMHRHCRYLLALRDRQMELMLMEFTLGVDIHLKNLRDAYASDVEARIAMQHLLPTEYTGLPLLVKTRLREEQSKKRRRMGRANGVMERDENGWVENWTGHSHPLVIASRDTIWHMRTQPRSRESDKSTQDKRKQNGTVNSKSRDGSEGETRRDSQQDPVASKQPVLGNGQNEQLAGSFSRTYDRKVSLSSGSESPAENRSRNETPPALKTARQSGLAAEERKPLGVANAQKTEAGSQLNPSNRVAAVLSQLTKEQQEKEKNGQSILNRNYVFRAAGELLQGVSRKQQRELALQKITPADSLSDKTAVTQQDQHQDLDEEYDAIPSYSKFGEKQGSGKMAHSSGFVSVPDQDCEPEDKGFDITTFKEAIPPPPYTITEDTNKSSAEEALAAILPRVENPSLLLDGSRTSHHSSMNPVQQKSVECVPVVASSRSDVKPVSCGSRNFVPESNRSITHSHSMSESMCVLDSRSAESILSTSAQSPVCAHTVNSSHLPGSASSPSQKASDGKQGSASNAAHSRSHGQSVSLKTQAQGTAASSCCSLPASVPPSAAQARTVAELSRASTDDVSCSPVKSTNTVSRSSSEASFSAAVSPCAQSPQGGSEGSLSVSELQQALASGESLKSIIGHKMTPQQLIAARFRRNQADES